MKPSHLGERIYSIDAMRTIAIIFMIFCHCTIYLTGRSGNFPWVYAIGEWMVGGFAAAFFTFLVGISFAVSSMKKGAWQSAKRGVLLFIFGLIFEGCAWGLSSTFDWDVLTLIGSAIVLLSLCQFLSDGAMIAIAFLSAWVAPLGRSYFHAITYWGSGYKNAPGIGTIFPNLVLDPAREFHASTVKDVLAGYFFNGFFPIFPWIVFPVMGFVVGRFLFVRRKSLPSSFLFSVGIILVGSGVTLAKLGVKSLTATAMEQVSYSHRAPFAFYPNTTALLLLQLGLCILLFGTLHRILDRPQPLFRHATSAFQKISQYSLTIYTLHHFILLWPVWIVGLMQGEPEKYYQDVLEPPQGLILGAILIFVLYGIVTLWSKRNGKYSLEWCMNQLLLFSLSSPQPSATSQE